jgi:hypothetical protein
MTSNTIFDDSLTETRDDEALRVAAILWDAKKRTAEHFAKVGAEAAVAEAAVADTEKTETAVQPDTAATK